ncbi:hypothetical protein KCU77_g3749, partial [Aureobasidium melanogenum]
MSYLEHEADMMITDEEESGEETLPSMTKQAVKLTVSSSGAKTTKPPPSPAVHLAPKMRNAKSGIYARAGEDHPKLKSKTVNELTNLYYGNENTSFRDLIVKAFHQKRMDELKDWEDQIGE